MSSHLNIKSQVKSLFTRNNVQLLTRSKNYSEKKQLFIVNQNWGKRELIALLNLSSWCLVKVERLFLTVPRGCLQFVIVVFPDHTHLLFWGNLSPVFSFSTCY